MPNTEDQTSPPNLRRTPLYDFHRRHGARFVDFGGWEMPVQYSSILEEHRAVRTAAGLFDVSHMGEVTVRGGQAACFLDHLLTNRIASQPDGKATYSPMCYPHGGTVDDVLIYKRADTDFLLCVNASNTAKDLKWIREQAVGFDCEIRDVSEDYALLALQGPTAAEILRKVAEPSLDSLKYYTFSDGRVAGAPGIISRTGYTGEDGFELFVPSEHAESLAESLLETGAAKGLQLAGLGARDSLRLEACYPLYGHELSDTISPLQAGLGWTVRFEKPDFTGREALIAQKEKGMDRKVVFFRTGGRRIVRAGTPVLADDREVGVVLSGTLSPMLNEAIGSALLATSALSGSLNVEIRGQLHPIQTVKPPFYRRS